jgi:hypothetical protein
MQAFERTHDTPYPPREARVASRARWDAFARRLREHLRLSLGLTPSLPDRPCAPSAPKPIAATATASNASRWRRCQAST